MVMLNANIMISAPRYVILKKVKVMMRLCCYCVLCLLSSPLSASYLSPLRVPGFQLLPQPDTEAKTA